MLAHSFTSAVAAADSGAEFSWGTLLLFVVGFLALAVVSSLGFIARMRDRATDRRVDAAKAEGGHPDASSSTR